jgi:integrase
LIEDARIEANKLRVTLDKGQDPRAIEREVIQAKQQVKDEAERAANFTFAALMNDYADELQRQGKISHSKVRGIFKKYLINASSELAATPAALVTSEQVTDLMRRSIDEGKTRTAGKLRSYSRAAFEMARTASTDSLIPVRFKGYAIRHNPVAEIKALKLNNDKDPLMPINLRQYWQHIKLMTGVKGAMLRVHLLTGGQRIEQLCRLHNSDLKTDSFIIFDGKGRSSKSARKNEVPLIAPALEAIKEITTMTCSGQYTFSITQGKTSIGAKSFSLWATSAASMIDWNEADGLVGEFKAKRIRSGVETCLASLRVPKEVRGHLLSHGVSGVQSISYDGYDYLDVKREALETFFRYLENDSVSDAHIAKQSGKALPN